MSYMALSKLYSILEDSSNQCEYSKKLILIMNDYDHLITLLNHYNYDYIQGNILILIKYELNIEEALATENELILTSDNTRINYKDAKLVITKYCNRKAVISVTSGKKYCKKCFPDKNQLDLSHILMILKKKDITYGLNVPDKIEYILGKHPGKKFSASEIYELGKPWDLRTLTPRNSVCARLSSLYRNGTIKKENNLYYK